MRKITGIFAVIGITIVIASMLSRYLNIIPDRERNIALVSGFTIMFLATIWRVVTDMNEPEKED